MVTLAGAPARAAWRAQPGTLGGAAGFLEMEATLDLTVGISASIDFLDQVSLTAIGETRPVQVEVWDKYALEKLAVLEGRYDLRVLEDHNDAGMGRFTLSRYDGKATPEILAPFNIVRFRYAGKYVFASRLESRRLVVVRNGDHESQEWQVSGRGFMGSLGYGVLYPEYEVDDLTRQQRPFFFGSARDAWYVPSEWFKPQGMKYKDVPPNHPWKGLPDNWPDANAQWIWSSNPNRQSDTETTWFRSTFTTTERMTLTVFMAADDAAEAFIDGYPVGSVRNGLLRGYSSGTVELNPGEHLLAVEVNNTTDEIPETLPETVTISPSPAKSGNDPYVGRGFSDGGAAYVNGDSSVRSYGNESAAFDGNNSTIWMSVGNYKGWSSAYEYVEGTFGKGKVTAVRINVHGGPYDVYISLKNGGGGWNGKSTIPYRSRVVDANADIRYVKKVRIPKNGNVLVPVPAQTADRVRITGHATWNSGFGAMPYRFALREVKVTGEEGLYVRGGNFAGLLLAIGTGVNNKGKIDTLVHRSQPSGWLCTTPPRPGWLPAQILYKVIEEARERKVLGIDNLKVGFTPYVDSYGVPWPDKPNWDRRDKAFGTGDDLLSVARQLAEDAPLDVWVDYETLTLHAAPERGSDVSEDVVLRPGLNLTDFGIDSGRPNATHLLVETPHGWLEAGRFDAAYEYGRVEAPVSYGNAMSLEEGRKSAENELDSSSVMSADASTEFTDITGLRPWVDFEVGDTITLPYGFGETLIRYRVLSISAREGDAGDLDVQVDTDPVDPNDLYTNPELNA